MKLFTYKTCSRFRTHCYPACKHYVIVCILKLHDKTNPFLYIYCISQLPDTRKHRFRAGYNQAEDRSKYQNLWEFHSIRM